jgi:tRNA (guanine26-N2/guanine27-N2)-dimethyltransferase
MKIYTLYKIKKKKYMKTKIISEGTVRIKVPVLNDQSNSLPSAAPVFYNPEMELNRDISTAVVLAYIKHDGLEPGAVSFADIMSATGIRSIRIASEAGLKCCLNDWNREAHELIRDNIKLNGVEHLCTASWQDANNLLHQESFDIVDIDPFGSPSSYLDSSARSVRKLLCITATDTAPLCGAHLNSGIRKYAAIPLNTEYHKEMGVRILLGAAVRALVLHDKGIQVLMAHATRHYVRLYIKIIKGVVAADRAVEQLGFISHCFNCGWRSWKSGLAPCLEIECPICFSTLKYAGPLWLGSIRESGFCQRVLDELEFRKPGKWEHASKIVAYCQNEIEIPTFYDQHWLCKKKKISPGPIDDLVLALKAAGFKASRTHFSGTGFKTDAGITQINEIILNRF